MKSFLIYLAMFSMLAMPAFSFAAQTDTDIPDPDFVAKKSLVPCGHANAEGVVTNPCSFKDAMAMINGGINFLLTFMAIPIAAIMFAYAGFLMVTSGGSTESRGKAKTIFANTALGLAFVAGAWIVVKTLLSILGYDGVWILHGF